MKRQGYVFDEIVSEKNLIRAIYNAFQYDKKGVKEFYYSNTKTIANELREKLISKTWYPTIVKHKTIVENGKLREVDVPLKDDLVVHWAVCNVLQKRLMGSMYHYNCGNIPNRGVDFARKSVIKIMKHYEQNGKFRKAYVLKLDIKKYFQNINHQKIKEFFRRKYKDPNLIDLLDKIIDCTENGLPIGFYTSQWFSNFYLEDLDRFIKEKLKIKHYIRQVDDLVLVDTDKRKLLKARKLMQQFLDDNNFGVWFKPNFSFYKLFDVPIDFIGYRFYSSKKVFVRKKIFKKMNRQIRRTQNDIRLRSVRARKMVAYMGWLKHSTVSRGIYLHLIKPVFSKKRIIKAISAHDSRQAKKRKIIQECLSRGEDIKKVIINV